MTNENLTEGELFCYHYCIHQVSTTATSTLSTYVTLTKDSRVEEKHTSIYFIPVKLETFIKISEEVK